MKPIFAFLLLLASCSLNNTVPKWTKSVPNEPAFFVAVAKTSLKQPDYQEIARNNAIRDISMQISTSIEASISLKESESFGMSNTEYLSLVSSNTSAVITDLPPEATYTDKTHYYALYRLNKERYYAQRRQMRDRNLALAVEMLKSYDESETHPAVAIPMLINALQQISDFLDMDLTHDGKNVYNEIHSRMRKLPNNLKLSWDNSQYQIVAKDKKVHQLKGKVTYKGSDSGAAQIPLSFRFSSGNGLIDTQDYSDENGEFLVTLLRISSYQPNQSIAVSIDKDKLCPNITKLTARKIWDSIVFPEVNMAFNVTKPSVYLDYTFVSGYQGGYKENLIGLLANQNIGLAKRSEDAQYIVQVKVTPRYSEYLPNLNYHTAFADISLSLKNPETGATVNYIESLSIKSGGKSRELAERNAEKDAFTAISDGLMYQLLYEALIK